MSDKREAILIRLLAIAEECQQANTDIAWVARNNTEITDRQVPALIILEGDEETPAVPEQRHRNASSPVPVVMVPQVCIAVMTATDKLGETLNGLRTQVIKAILGDSELIALLGTNGAIAYRGMVSDLGEGRAMLGRFFLRFAISYFLKPSDL